MNDGQKEYDEWKLKEEKRLKQVERSKAYYHANKERVLALCKKKLRENPEYRARQRRTSNEWMRKKRGNVGVPADVRAARHEHRRLESIKWRMEIAQKVIRGEYK